VVVAGRPIVVDTRKALAIVALVAAEGRPFARDELAAMFWAEADDEAARGALRRTLSALRTAVGGRGLRIDRTRVALDVDAAWVDLAELERLAASGRPAGLEAAAALARGPFLAGFALRDCPAFDDWQAVRATRVERTVGDLLERLAAVRLGDGDLGGAVEVSRRRVELDPLDEDGQRRLIETLARTGDRAGAIGQYRALVALFDRELGVPPLRETTALYDAIREGRLLPQPAGRLAAEVARPDHTRPTAATAPAAPDRPVDWPFAGREVELAAILGAWRAAAPDGRLAIVEGEPGIGKTRFAETVQASVQEAGGIVLASRGYPGEAAVAYGPIAELLRAGMAQPGGAGRLADLDDGARREIGRLVDLPPSLRVAGLAGPDDASARVRLLEGVARGLAALAGGSTPGLVWIDDLHLADGPTREAAAYLARRLAGRPMLLLLAWRREDLSAEGAAIADDLARRRDATVVSLGRLDRAAIAEIVRAARPAEADDPSVEALVDSLVADSEGLPLHVVEALAGGDPPGAGLPHGVQAILRDRIASVGETAAQVLSAAAVIGRSFDLATVRATSGRSEVETVEALEELMRRGIVRELPGSVGGPVRYDFAHGRLRDAAYEATSLARRRLLHRRTADALRLDAAGAGRDDVGRYALIAAHEREAGRPDAAVAAYLEAAARAEAVFANREAIGHLEAALALDPSVAGGVHERIGELRSRLGEYPAAIAALETAAALASPDDLPAIEVALGRVHRRRGDLAAAESHLASALGSGPPELTDALRARAQVERSLVALRAGDLDTAEAAAREARHAADGAADRHLAGVAERLVGLIAQARGDAPRALAALERSLDLAADDPDPTASIAALTALALTLAAAGSVDEAVATATAAAETCRRIGDRHLEAAVENHLADICHEAGRAEASMAHLKRAVALFAEIGEGAPQQDPGIWALAAW
jgi:DNA-binding SARP family transcriptional activator/tetratricopeptide (TPR) repeat protein